MTSGTPHILVVDDNEMNRDLLSRRLVKKGYDVSTAEDGQEAIDLISNLDYDLVLLDIMMPKVSGLDVLQHIRSTRSATDLPVIMATAKDSSGDVVVALEMGANDYVTKPLDFSVVLARCKTQLSLRKASLEIRTLNQELEQRNEFIRRTFGRYVSHDVVKEVLDSPEGLALGGEKRVITLLMSDLRGFSAMCETVDPQRVVRVLNVYLGAMTEVITQFGGTIDEFIGDGIFVLFGAPAYCDDHAYRAVSCAVAMQQMISTVNDQLRSEGLDDVAMGIGIHTGEVVIGNVGSEHRAKYGAVGNNVNITGRIETFSVGGQVLVSESTRAAIGDDLIYDATITMEGKGLRRPIELFNIRGLRSEGAVLADSDIPLQRLKAALNVSLVQLRGKHLGSTSHSATVTSLSPTTAEIQCEVEIPLWSNLCIHFSRFPDEDPVYGKIIQHLNEEGTGFYVRFTSAPTALHKVLHAVGMAE